MTTSTSPTSSGSSAEVTSSKSMTFGDIISARAMATRCCWPPESWCGCWPAFSGSPTTVEQLRRAQLGLLARQLPDPPRSQRQVVHHRQVREQVELLEHDPDPLPDVRDVDALARDLLALEADPPGLDRLEEVDAAEERALPAAARPDDHEHLAGRDLEVDPVEDEVVAEALPDALELRRSARSDRRSVGPTVSSTTFTPGE